MNSETIKDKILRIANNNKGGIIPATDTNPNFDEYMDSLDKIEFVMEVEEEFSIEISDIEAEKIKTLNQAVGFIERKLDNEYNDSVLEVSRGFNGSSFKKDVRASKRQMEVFEALLKEREYQEDKWKESIITQESLNRPNDWIVYIQRYLNKAMMDEGNSGGRNTLDQIRKIGAMCMAAMEQNEIVERESE